MIVNIGTQLNNIVNYLKGIISINSLFDGKIYAEIPAINIKIEGIYMYLALRENIPTTNTDLKDGLNIIKRATVSFIIIGENQQTISQELFEKIDTINNQIVGQGMQIIGDIKVLGIYEGRQSGVLRDKKNIPVIETEFVFDYISNI